MKGRLDLPGEGVHKAMKRRRRTLLLGLGLSMILLIAAGQVYAALGEAVDSVESDRETLTAVKGAITARSGYTIHEMRTQSTVVREYVSTAGIVFAIAWNGIVHPNLTELLGSYAGEYEEALQQTPRKQGRRQLQVKANRVVVEKWGHIRDLRGRAYAPALIPPGVSIDAIR